MQPSRVEIRIVAGTLRGRKIATVVHDELRPTPQRVRESLFSILGNAIPGRTFFDLFAGTGVHGLESISRGGAEAVFVEADAKLVTAMDTQIKRFDLQRVATVFRADVYRWAERWIPPTLPVNLFLSPPFIDLTERYDAFLALVSTLAEKAPFESCLCIQAEDGFPTEKLPGENWDVRKYGRNVLAIWVKEEAANAETPKATPES